jgi:glutamate-1-semialdehyde 2,1-aminomutase
MRPYPKSLAILNRNRRYIPGGIASVNRSVEPEIVFTKGKGAQIWDAEGHAYLDYHAAFAPHILGHNHPAVTSAVERVLRDDASLFGSGTTELEGRLAELICRAVPFVDDVQLLNTGSEATYQAIRLARAVTGRDHIIVMQGGYNGWHNDVSCNLMTPLSELGPRLSPGEYPYMSISAGVPEKHRALVRPVNFNDLESVEYVCKKYPVAAIITEPILQNIGVVHPLPGYLAGLKEIANRYGALLIFDEVKTGFRHAPGGYASLAGVEPDVVVYGKALANGYPMAAIAGKRDLMRYFVHPDPGRRVLLAGTYNGHPVPTAAAIATIETLLANDGEAYKHLEALGARLEAGVHRMLATMGNTGTLARQGSAFCLYFMDHEPVDWHDLAENHDFATDLAMRRQLIDRGIYFFPLAVKQGSISTAHTPEDIDVTLEQWESALGHALLAEKGFGAPLVAQERI